jgi:hypothetical protein
VQRHRGYVAKGKDAVAERNGRSWGNDNIVEISWSLSEGHMSGGARERCDNRKGTDTWVM